ncbi:hypothetical protein BHE74_00056293 [Ensete ventricosum]|uniref:Uncharacterized protein n=1 Tax=Ensete ventricosum TaxID=4639 RepID=A0A426XT85_ENSVE|nr:hypothetical protein B296_00056956 [Ensete ventricosum]RWW38463.1 hypothetical protein BHE74_00056293 [Ensete ventricosum]
MVPTPSSPPSRGLRKPHAAAPATDFFPVLSSPRALSSAFRGHRRFRGNGTMRMRRLVVRAGAPSTNTLIIAFVFPLSLLVGTIFTAVRVADRLDEKYLEEVRVWLGTFPCLLLKLAMNKAIMEEKEAEEDDSDKDGKVAAEEAGSILPDEEEGVAAVPRVRNRPKREAQL